MSRIILLISLLALTACQFNLKPSNKSINEAPSAHAYTNKAHPLGKGQIPMRDTERYGLLLLAESGIAEPERAQAACRSLFTDTSMAKPSLPGSSDEVVTYLPVNQSGDFTRVSTRFKWGMCSRITRLQDHDRERDLLATAGYSNVRGPLLLAMEGLRANHQYQGARSVVIADLSKVADQDIQLVIKNWLKVTQRRDVWNDSSSLAASSKQLNDGLEHTKVALYRVPDVFDKSLASR